MITINGKDFDQGKARVEPSATSNSVWMVMIQKTPVDYYDNKDDAERCASAIRRLRNGGVLNYNARGILCKGDVPLASPRGSRRAAS